MNALASFALGLVLGGGLGFCAAAIFAAAGRADRRMEEMAKREE